MVLSFSQIGAMQEEQKCSSPQKMDDCDEKISSEKENSYINACIVEAFEDFEKTINNMPDKIVKDEEGDEMDEKFKKLIDLRKIVKILFQKYDIQLNEVD